MKQVMVQLDQFRGILANRTEQIMCRSKHSDKVKVVDTYSDRFNERTDLVKIPISAEIIVCRKYEDANMKSFPYPAFRTGKRKCSVKRAILSKTFPLMSITSFLRITILLSKNFKRRDIPQWYPNCTGKRLVVPVFCPI